MSLYNPKPKKKKVKKKSISSSSAAAYGATPTQQHNVTAPPPKPVVLPPGLKAPDLGKLSPTAGRDAKSIVHLRRRLAKAQAASHQVETAGPTPSESYAAALGALKKKHEPVTLSSSKGGKSLGGVPSEAELEVKQSGVEGYIPRNTTGQKIYGDIAKTGYYAGSLLIPAGPEIKAGYEGAKAIVKGVQVGEDVVGGIKAARSMGVGAKEASDSLENRAKVAAAKADEKVVQRTTRGPNKAPTPRSKFKTTAGSAARKVRRTKGKSQRELQRDLLDIPTPRQVSQARGAPALAGKVGGAQVLPVVQGHEQALLHNPGKTLGTTVRAIPGFITVPIGMAANVGLTGGRAASEGLHAAGVPGFKGYSGKDILKPVKYEGESQLNFAKQVAKVLTSGDSKYVQKQVEENLGLTLPITLGLTGKAALDHLSIGDKSLADHIVEKTRNVVEGVRRKEVGGLAPHGPGAKINEKASQRRDSAHIAYRGKAGASNEYAMRTNDLARAARRTGGKDKLRTGTGRTLTGRKRNVVIHKSDTAPFLARIGSIDLRDPAKALAEVKTIDARIENARTDAGLSPRVKPVGNKLNTHDITQALIDHPEWLSDPRLIDLVAKQRAIDKTVRDLGLQPDSSEAARFSSDAIHNDIPTADERPPADIAPYMRHGARRGVKIEDALKEEARRNRRSADKLDKQATKLETKAKAIRGEMARRGRQKGEITPQAHAGAMHRADRMIERAAQMRAQAKVIRDIAERKDAARTNLPNTYGERSNAMVADVKAHLGDRAEPAYVNTGTATDFPDKSAGYASAIPGKGKHKTGRAEELGMVEEGFAPYLRNTHQKAIQRKHIFAAVREFLSRNQYKDANGLTEFSANKVRNLFESDPNLNMKNWAVVPVSQTKRAYDYIDKSTSESPDTAWSSETRALVNEHDLSSILNRGAKGEKFHIVPRAASKEFFDQMTAAGTAPKIQALTRATSYLMLGTSPAWAIAQIGAEFAQAAIAEPRLLNPIKLRQYLQAYHALAPDKRIAFDAWAGPTRRTLESHRDIELGMDTGHPGRIGDALSVLDQTPIGHAVKAIPNTLREIDRWKGGRFRVLATIAKMDRDVNGHLNKFLQGTGNLRRAEKEIWNQLQGKSPAEIASFWADHPKTVDRYARYIDDMMGNWGALTRNERIASQVAVFYPFMRMSLRWLFYAFPKEHPIRAAMSYWLGQQNAVRVKELFGDPSFFTEWGNVPLYNGEGPDDASLLQLQRLGVGSNALIESLGQGSKGGPVLGQIAQAVVQPAITAPIAGGFFGINPITGEQESGSLANAANQIIGLSPLTRDLQKAKNNVEGTKPTKGAVMLLGSTKRQEALDKLFEKLRGGLQTELLKSLTFAPIPETGEHAKDVRKTGRILESLSDYTDQLDAIFVKNKEAGIPGVQTAIQEAHLEELKERTQRELNKMFDKYKIPYKKEGAEWDKYGEEVSKGPPKSNYEKITEKLGIGESPYEEIQKKLGGSGESLYEEIQKKLGH